MTSQCNTVRIGTDNENVIITEWEDNIRMDLRETGWEGVDWMHLAQDMDQWLAVVNTVMKIRVPYKVGNFLTS